MMRSFHSGKKFIANHQALADPVLARDVGKSQTMLEAHLRSTLDIVYPPGKGS
jgi:DNA-binding GntR family transcriptional regulator